MYTFQPISSNRKTGPMPTVYAHRSTCPPTCPHKDADCYAEDFYTRLAWNRTEKGMNIDTLARCIEALRPGTVWRYGIAGDLPGKGSAIDAVSLGKIVHANRGKRGFAYSHKRTATAIKWMLEAVRWGFTINLSADDAGEAGLLAPDDDALPDSGTEDAGDGAELPDAVADAKGWGNWPDLVIIDGGKGQLSAALEAMTEVGVDVGPGGLPVVGLAKQFEEVFRPGHRQPILLARNSQALYLMQRVRDEAHRFAVTFHQQVRAKRQVGSRLDHIDGVGPKRKKALMVRFGSLAGIRTATDDELLGVPGITRAIVAQLREQL